MVVFGDSKLGAAWFPSLWLFVARFSGLLAAFAYGATSISIVFVNKAIFTLYAFPFSNTLTAAQMLVALVGLVVARRCGLVDYPPISMKIVRAVFPLALSFISMVVTGLAALNLVNVPMYSALRRLATLIVMVMQFFLIGKRVSYGEGASTFVMVFGAIVAGYGDISFDLIGYSLTALNCLVTAAYLVYIAKVTADTGLSTFGLMFYNNLLSLPVVAVIVLLFESEGVTRLATGDAAFQLLFLVSAIQAFLLNYFIYLCSTLNSPLTTSITGQIKSIATTVWGLFAFGDVEITSLLLAGLALSTAGGCWYGRVKYMESAQKFKKSEVYRL